MTPAQQILGRLTELTPSQQALAKYVVDHSEQVALMTAKELAHATSVSDAAVVRFARAVGYDGFSHMRVALRTGLLERAGASGMQQEYAALNGTESIRQRVFEHETSMIAQTETLNDEQLAIDVVDRLIGARRIWVSGHGSTYPLAAYFAMHFNQVLGKTETFTIGQGDVADKLCQVDKTDVFIGIGYMRYLPYTVDLMKAAASKGAHVVAVTDRPSSPLARTAQSTFLVARNMPSVAWWSQAGTWALADWLTALIMARDSENVGQRLREADLAWKRLGHWDSEDDNNLSLTQLKAGSGK